MTTEIQKQKKQKTEYQKFLQRVKTGPSTNAFYAFMQRLLQSFEPKEILSPDEWADKYRYISKSEIKGKWDSNITAYTHGPSNDFCDSSVDTIVLMWASQVGKSAFMESIIGSIIHQDPSNIYFVGPDEKSNNDFKQDKLEDMFQCTPCFYKEGRVKPAAPGKSDTNARKIRFAGGYLSFATSNSMSSLAGRSVRYLFLDEVDRFLQSKKEGDIVALAKNRTNSFVHSRKIVITSTPTDKDSSKIYKAYLQGDQRKFFVACPHCELRQTLVFDRVRWDTVRDAGGNIIKHLPETAYYECESGCKITSAQKAKAVQSGEWRATAEPLLKKTRSYHLNFLYSPFVPFDIAVEDYLKAKDDKDQLKTFVNTKLGEVWDDPSEQPDYMRIYNRAELYTRGVPPAGVGLLHATCDVQEKGEGRLEVGVWGYGRNKQLWLVDHIVIPGSYRHKETWDELAQLKDRVYQTADGRELQIGTMLVDSSAGNTTPYVYEFCAGMPGRWAIPLKGRSGRGVARINVSKIETDSRGQRLKRGLHLIEPNVSYFKFALYAQLDETVQPTDAGYIHTPQFAGVEWHKQLVSEKVMTDIKTGNKKFIKTGANEALDLAVYALALAEYKRISSYTDRDWDRVFEKQGVDVEEMQPEEENKAVEESSTPAKTEICILRKCQLQGNWLEPGTIVDVDEDTVHRLCNVDPPFAHKTSERPPLMSEINKKVELKQAEDTSHKKVLGRFFTGSTRR
jgi:phage terminase large subunit GpA-like protein